LLLGGAAARIAGDPALLLAMARLAGDRALEWLGLAAPLPRCLVLRAVGLVVVLFVSYWIRPCMPVPPGVAVA
jgi:hypothetical protein